MKTKEDLKRIRHALGFSLSEMAKILGLTSGESIRFMESGKKEITGPISKLLEIYEEKIDENNRKNIFTNQ